MKNTLIFSLGCLLTSACGRGALSAAPPEETVARDRVCQGPVAIRDEADLRSVAERCPVIDGDLMVAGTTLTSLDGLEGIREARHVVVVRNPALASIAGLRGLARARGITVMENTALESLSGLENVRRLDSVVIAGNAVRSLGGLEGLDSVGELVIANNPRLTDLRALHATTLVADIEDNGAPAGRAEGSLAEAGAVPPNG